MDTSGWSDVEDEELSIPTDIFASPPNANTSSIANNDESAGGDREPPPNYLPKGWVLFKVRGPMSFPIENCLDFFSEAFGDSKHIIKNGRDHHRKQVAMEKSASRDYAFNETSVSMNSSDIRGVGVGNWTFAIKAAQGMRCWQCISLRACY